MSGILATREEMCPLLVGRINQAGEIRSTKNLSGGESFIVSLSLALGLSHMASKNVRVDSLFLDEGFGTLDEEALDTALETLAGLEQGWQADRRNFARTGAEGANQHPDPGNTSYRRQEPDIRAWMRQVERSRTGYRNRLS